VLLNAHPLTFPLPPSFLSHREVRGDGRRGLHWGYVRSREGGREGGVSLSLSASGKEDEEEKEMRMEESNRMVFGRVCLGNSQGGRGGGRERGREGGGRERGREGGGRESTAPFCQNIIHNSFYLKPPPAAAAGACVVSVCVRVIGSVGVCLLICECVRRGDSSSLCLLAFP